MPAVTGVVDMARPWKDPLAATVRPRRAPYQRSQGGRSASARTTDPALGWEHQQQRQRLRDAHVDGTPCPCLQQNDCGPACPCRPVGVGLPMYLNPKRNVDGRMLEADHTLARSRGGRDADRLMLSVCNRSRQDGTNSRPQPSAAGQGRMVVVLCGPPGAGKTTAAHLGAAALGLQVYDRDDARWRGEADFTAALAALAVDSSARAVVIRAAATSSARARAAALTGATHTYLLTASADELARRVVRRGRADAQQGLAAIGTWFDRHDVDDHVPTFPGWDAITTTTATPAAEERARRVAATSTAW